MYKAVILEKNRLDTDRIKNCINASSLPIGLVSVDSSILCEYIREQRPEIIVINISDNKKCWLDLIKNAISIKADCQVIITSTYQEFSYDIAREAIELGIAGYLIKPIDPEMMINYFNNIITKIEKESTANEVKMKEKEENRITMETSTNANALTNKIYEYIDNNYAKEISLSDIRKEFNISESYIRQLLIKHKGKSFIKILTDLRIKKAKELLRKNVDMSIQEIAFSVGYGDAHYFSRVYKAQTGTSPSVDKML